MGFIQIGASILIALLIGALTPKARTLRMYLLLASSVLAVYWFQPALPIRSFDFWLPSLSLALTILTWLVTSPVGSWRLRPNLVGLSIIVALVTLIDLSRYLLPEPVLALGISLLGLLSRRSSWALTFVILLIVTILVILKSPALSLQASILLRTLANRPIENAAFTDLRWLGFSYIAFRLIHVLRDRQ